MDAIYEQVKEHYEQEKDYVESNLMIYNRAQQLKAFMREYLRNNPLRHQEQEKYGLVCHGHIITSLYARGMKMDDPPKRAWVEDCYIDTKLFENCQYEAFFRF